MTTRPNPALAIPAAPRLGRFVALGASALLALGARAAAAGEPIALPAPASFAAAVEAIERATGVRGEPFEAGEAKGPALQSRSFALDGATANRLLDGSHATFRKAGLYLFRYERSYGLPGEKDHVALLATADRGAVVRRVGTSDPKDGLTPDRLVSWLDALAKDEPFELSEIGVDYVAGRFLATPKDPAEIARRSAEIAPDLVAGRATTLALLANEIRTNRTLFLIW